MARKNKTDEIRLSTRKYGSKYVTTHLMASISTRNKLKLALIAAEQNSSLSEALNWLIDGVTNPPMWEVAEQDFDQALYDSSDQELTLKKHIERYREVYKNEGITPSYNTYGIKTG